MLTLRNVATAGYRSLRSISYPVGRLEVFVGPNGVGKTNLYRGLEMLRAAADNQLGLRLAQEGFRSALWAGPARKKGPVRVTFAATLADEGSGAEYEYTVTIGLPALSAGAFSDEPHVKEETLAVSFGGRPARLLDRRGPAVTARDPDGRPVELDLDLLDSETALGRLHDPERFPAIEAVRRTLMSWRFFHEFRTDADSPLRRPCTAIASPTLSSDGANLAAVFATLAHIRGDTVDLDRAIDGAFPGATLEMPAPDRQAEFGMNYPEFPYRTFAADELSDGTLRFLALAGALLAYRLPPLIALNEPESSLHPDMMEPLAGLIRRAAQRTQVWLVTHSERLAGLVAEDDRAHVRQVTKKDGATWIEGLKLFGAYGDDED